MDKKSIFNAMWKKGLDNNNNNSHNANKRRQTSGGGVSVMFTKSLIGLTVIIQNFFVDTLAASTNLPKGSLINDVTHIKNEPLPLYTSSRDVIYGWSLQLF